MLHHINGRDKNSVCQNHLRFDPEVDPVLRRLLIPKLFGQVPRSRISIHKPRHRFAIVQLPLPPKIPIVPVHHTLHLAELHVYHLTLPLHVVEHHVPQLQLRNSVPILNFLRLPNRPENLIITPKTTEQLQRNTAQPQPREIIYNAHNPLPVPTIPSWIPFPLVLNIVRPAPRPRIPSLEKSA
jgi:hypothetical protein